jgi:pre-mRNA-splicing factor SYF2
MCESTLRVLNAPLPDQSALQVAPETTEEQIDAMVAELDARKAKRAGYSRRRAYQPDKDVDFINDRNAHFNKKIARAFDKHTQEIKANLERGTALPEH